MARVENDPPRLRPALRLRLRLARDEDPTRRVGSGFGRPETVEIGLEPPLERARLADGRRVNDQERVTEIGGSLGAEEPDDRRSEGCAGEDAGQDVHGEGEPVALVAGRLLEPPEREKGTRERLLGRRRETPLGSYRPGERKPLSAPGCDLDPASRDRGCRHVQADPTVGSGRRGDRDRVGPDERAYRPRRRDERRAVRERP